MANEFTSKRYTTIVHRREIVNCITGHKTKFPDVYGVYDNKTQTDVVIEGFKPRCYEEIRSKAIELNNQLKN